MGLIGDLFGHRRLRHQPAANLLEDYKALAQLLDALFTEIEAEIHPGVKTSRFDVIAANFIRAAGVRSCFKKYRGFPAYMTTSINHEVLNTLPSGRKLAEGDLFKIQTGIMDGVGYSYQSWTYFVGRPRAEDEVFLAAGNEALERAVRQVKARGNVFDVTRAIQSTLEAAGYSPNEKYVGHGMGRGQHEPPQIPCRVPAEPDNIKYQLSSGQLVSIQVIAHAGRSDCGTMKDGWSVETKDRSRALMMSQIVAAGDDGPDIITAPRNSQPGS